MKRIEKFESFSMRSKCARCQSNSDTTTMSRFNTDVICMECKVIEEQDPDYRLAGMAEIKEIQKGNLNYEGMYPNYKPLILD